MNKIVALIITLFISSGLSSQSKSYTVACMGDIVFGLNYPENYKRLLSGGGHYVLKNLSPHISSADIAFGNLEGVFLDSGGEPKKVRDTTNCYHFRMPEIYADILRNSGIDCVSIANNHAKDFGWTGLNSTMKVLSKYGINYAGVKNVCETSIIERNGIKYGFCAFAPNSLMLSIFEYNYAENLVKTLHQLCDVVVVSMHAGAEGSTKNRVPRVMEEYAGEKRGNVYKFAHKMIDAGADIVFGHGPHVVRGIELYKDRLIAYSLGNFCTPFGVNKKGRNGYAPLLKVNITNNGIFIDGEIVGAKQIDSKGPKIINDGIVINEIARLSSLDFPESKLKIEKNGKIIKIRD